VNFPDIWPVTCHTRHVGAGSTFVAIKGQDLDGADFIVIALARGAKKIVVDSDANITHDLEQLIVNSGAQLLRVVNTRLALAQLSAHAHNWPSRKLKIIGITGTKGKTTVACLTYHMLRTSGYSAALLCTVYNKINDQLFEANLTTPQPDYLHVFFNECVKRNVEYVVMEVAAQAVNLHRVHNLAFDAVAFTNFGHEHSEFYATFDDYFNAKVEVIFKAKVGAQILINADDFRVSRLVYLVNNVQLFSVKKPQADWYAILDAAHDNLSGTILHGNDSLLFACPSLLGKFNGENILVAAGLAHSCGVSMSMIKQACSTMPSLPGRLECYTLKKGVQYIIDYAHTPESYEHVLSFLRKKTDCLTVIFGAGGGRDHSKRPIMGAIAAQYADRIFLTTDNPRAENPINIVSDIIAGMKKEQKNKVIIELNREKAIKESYQLAQKGDIIVLLGKGPDEYQLIKKTKMPFSEKTIIQQLEN